MKHHITQEWTSGPFFHGPLYTQVAKEIRREITDGHWKVGDLLPGELDLAKRYEVSVGTMRKALEMLAEDELIRRKRGRGTIVIASQPKERRSILRRWMEAPTVLDVKVRNQPAPADAAEILCIPKGARITVLERAITLSDRSHVVDHVRIPHDVYKKIRHVDLLSDENLEDAYQRIDPSRSLHLKEWISIAPVSENIARELKIPRDARVLRVTRLLCLGEEPLEHTERYLHLAGVAYTLQLSSVG